MEIVKRKRGRPRKNPIINNEPEIISEQQEEQETIEEHWEKKSASRNATWDEDSVSTIQDNDFLAELDNEHYKEDPIVNVDDLFKNIRPQRTKVKREKKSQFEDDNSLFSERGTEILGQERRVLLSKIQQYKNLFMNLKNLKLKRIVRHTI